MSPPPQKQRNQIKCKWALLLGFPLIQWSSTRTGPRLHHSMVVVNYLAFFKIWHLLHSFIVSQCHRYQSCIFDSFVQGCKHTFFTPLIGLYKDKIFFTSLIGLYKDVNIFQLAKTSSLLQPTDHGLTAKFTSYYM